MADTLTFEEPPAKKVCRDAPSNDALEQPDIPVDDTDDDFYGTGPIKPPVTSTAPEKTLPTASSEPSSMQSAPSFEIPGLGLPGLGLLSAIPKKESPTASDNAPVPFGAEVEHAKIPAAVDNALPPPDANIQGGNTPVVAENGTVPTVVVDGKEISGELPLQNAEAEEQAKAEFLAAGEANKNDENAEWQLDSSDSDTSSDSSSDDSSGDDSDDEGLLMDPEETARMLMQMEDDDEGGAAGPAKLKTTNEIEETFEKPDIKVTPDMKITDLGTVESVVGNMVLIKAKVSGDYMVLDSSSALCLADRTVIGQVSETIGRVQEPRYSLGFSDASEIATLGIQKGTAIYYVNDHSKFVYTEPLKAQKFTDASNLHDEEANDSEFSDDEKEAEYKRNKKLEKRAARTGQSHTNHSDAPPVPQARQNQYQSGGLNYSDDEDLGMYKPLARPDHFEDIVGAGAPIEDRSHVRRGGPRPARGGRGRGDRSGPRGGRGGGRGGGDGGRGDRGGRGGRGGPRGGHHHDHNRHDNRHKQLSPQATRSPRPSVSPARRRHAPPEHSLPHAAPTQNLGAASGNAQASSFSQPLWPYQNQPSTQYPPNAYSPAPNAYNPPNAYTPANPSPPALPAGAFINPSFQAPQTNAPQDQAQQMQNMLAWAQIFSAMQQSQSPANVANVANVANPSAPPPPPSDPQAAYQAAQRDLDILRALNRGPGPQ